MLPLRVCLPLLSVGAGTSRPPIYILCLRKRFTWHRGGAARMRGAAPLLQLDMRHAIVYNSVLRWR